MTPPEPKASSNEPQPLRGCRVELRSVQVWRGEGTARKQVLHDISLEFATGSRVALVGPNGAGKTSLLLALVGAAGFEGQIQIGDAILGKQSLRSIRARTGFVFADPSDQLFMPTAYDEVAFGPRQRALPESEVQARVRLALLQVDLLAESERRPSTLSLGEQRRLAVASVLACQPELILLDEPTAGLDPVARWRMLRVIREAKATVVLATHDLDAARDLDADIVLLRGGQVLGRAPAAQVLADSALLIQAGLALPAEELLPVGAALL